MLTEPLTGARKPEETDGPLGGLQISNLADDLAPDTIPYFTTASARDTAFSNWVSAGHSMRNGLHCYVSGIGDQVYVSGSWQKLVPTQPTRGIAAFTLDNSGLGYINHGLSVAPTTATLTPVYTSDGINNLFVPTVGALTVNQIQVVAFRSDTHQRLATTPVQVAWVAWP